MSKTGLLLGCIADDLTGATDLANTLARRGMRVVRTTDLGLVSYVPLVAGLVGHELA